MFDNKKLFEKCSMKLRFLKNFDKMQNSEKWSIKLIK